MITTSLIKKIALEVGFDLCGVTPCQHLKENETRFFEWLDNGYNSNLDYMSRNLDKRFDTRKLVEGAHTVIVCAVSYKNHISEGYPADFKTKIASYACTTDYHTTIKEMLRRITTRLTEIEPNLKGRMFVDTAPLLEKQHAVEAGLGWIGRQSLLITPRFGSYVLLGELVINQELDEYDEPFAGSRCGRCNNCIDSCPTGAIVAPKVIDTRRCISCHTIECASEVEHPLDGWIFGCVMCQSCCPHNHKAPMHTSPLFDPTFDPQSISTQEWLSMSEQEFNTTFSKSPLKRSGLERIKSNIKI